MTDGKWTPVAPTLSAVVVEGQCEGSMLAALLQLAMSTRPRGRLEIATPDGTFRFRFADGFVVTATETPSQPERRLGDLLVQSGRLSQEAIDTALEMHRAQARRLGEVLVEQDALSRAELATLLQQQALLRIDAALAGSDVHYRILEDHSLGHEGDAPLGVRVEELIARARGA